MTVSLLTLMFVLIIPAVPALAYFINTMDL